MSSVDDDRYWVGPAAEPDTYQLISPLGGGGEGEVWKGLVPLSESGRGLVAIKILPPSEAEDQESWSRYSHLLKSLDHPGIVRVIDTFLGPAKHRTGTVEATEVDTTDVPSLPGMWRYVIMKLVEGVTLREWLDDTPDAPISRRMRALAMVASALDEMHSGNQTGVPVAHGDVKPSNIIMREDGSAVLVDLGLTRLADGQGRTGRSRPYAAPELFVSGAVTTPEADRFAFYATLVHAMTGQPPATADGRGTDVEAVAGALRENELTGRRPLLVNGVVGALQSAPEGRPHPLTTWLASLSDTLSQTTQPFGAVTTTAAAPVKVKSGHMLRRILVATAALVFVVGGTAIGYAVANSGDAGNGPTQGQSAGSLAVVTELSPTPQESIEPSPSDTAAESPSPGASDSPSPEPAVSDAPAVEPGADYFADTDKFQATDTTGYDSDPANLNGQFYTQNMLFGVYYTGDHRYATFVLGRHYSQVKTVVGVADSANSDLKLRIEIITDNKTIFRKDIGKGTTATVNLPVAGVYQITFSITKLSGGQGKGVFADARVLP